MLVQLAPSRRAAHSLNDVARQVAPHLRIVSASRPTPVLRDYNVVAYTDDTEAGRRAVLALEGVEHADDQLGTVVMGFVPGDDTSFSNETPSDERHGVDPEGVDRAVVPRVIAGGLLGFLTGAAVVGAGAFVLGASGWRLVGAAAAGAMMVSVFGAIWLAFAGLGGRDAYRQTFVDEDARELTIVSVHTDDPAEAATARDRLANESQLALLAVDRFGHIERDPRTTRTPEP
jgi:hypothetical protein